MPCKPISGPGWSGFACSRNSSPLKQCSCGCPAEYICDFPRKGKKEGKTCDKPICRSHAKLIKKTSEGSIHYCPAHQRMAEKAKPRRVDIRDLLPPELFSGGEGGLQKGDTFKIGGLSVIFNGVYVFDVYKGYVEEVKEKP